MFRKGFTLVELMIVILIVAILAAVAIPLMTGRLDAAKWSEAKSAMGTIATGVRAYYAEHGKEWPTAPTTPAEVGVMDDDLDATYFTHQCYALSGVSCDAAGHAHFTITCTAADSTRGNKPTHPASVVLTDAGAGASFTETP